MANPRRAGVSEPRSDGERLKRARADRERALFAGPFAAFLFHNFR